MAKSHPDPPLKIPPWTEKNEVNLLNAILEIANEPIESYDPKINLFDRINKNMEKLLTDREILDKIKELRKRFEKRCWNREFWNKAVKRTRAFAISEEIWGKGIEMKIEMKRRKKNAKSLKVNPQEASRPNPKQERTKKRNKAEPKHKCQPAGKKQKVKGSCFVCGNFGHFASDCSNKKQPTKQQESSDILKGSVGLQFETENKHKELSGGSVFASLKVNPQESCSPNPKQECTKKRNKAEPKNKCQAAGKKQKVKGSCFVCGNFGHFASDCSKKKIAKQPTNQQESKDISKGSVGLQFETGNKHKELSGGSVFDSSQPGSIRLTSEQTKQRDAVHDRSQPVAQFTSKNKVEDYISSQSISHQPTLEQRMKFNNLQHGDNQHTSELAKQRDEMRDSSQPVAQEDYISFQSIVHQPSSEQRLEINNSPRGDNQHTSEQRMKGPTSFKPGTYQHTSKQKKPFNRFQPSSHQQVSNQWRRESFTPPILPHPPNWGPPNPIAMPHSFTQNLVPYQYPPLPVYRQSPPPNSMNYPYYPCYPN